MSYSFVEGSAIVTGAASGIGRAAATVLAAGDLHVVGVDITADPGDDGPHFETAVAEGTLVEGDVRAASTIDEAVTAAQRNGPVQAVVTCAGIGAQGGPDEVDTTDLRKAFAVHVEGTYRTITSVLPEMRRRGSGAVVTTSSIAAHVGWRGTTDYAPAKGGVEALTRELAAEVSPDGVRVNGVAPGFVRTGMNADVWSDDQSMSDGERVDIGTARERTLLPWLGEPEDVGQVIAFLASEEARFITGQIIRVDGGWTVNAW